MSTPKDLLFSKNHEWVRVDGDKAYVGISDFAQHQMGDIVFVEMPEIDDEVAAGGQIGVIESVKAVSSMFSPVGGTIVEVNEDLEDSPELLNEDAFKNHIAVVEMNNKSDLDVLLSPEAYEAICKEEEQGGH